VMMDTLKLTIHTYCHRISFGRRVRDSLRICQSVLMTCDFVHFDLARRKLVSAMLFGGDNVRRRCGFLVDRSIWSLFRTGYRRRRRVAVDLAPPPPAFLTG